MPKLLGQILDAHGGIDRWNKYEKVEATIVTGGGFFPLKSVIQDADPRRMSNICRCRTYVRIREAIKQAAQSGQGG